jgi:phosphatidylserine/phosphatidylglycerophosphate/cardiolipin synthase-like enzyme
MTIKKYLARFIFLAVAVFSALPSAAAQERLCDPSFEDCRTPLLNLIRNETVGIDVAFWFMEDSRYANELIRRHQAGVPIRVIIDPRANSTYPFNAQMLNDLAAAGIPMRRKLSGGIMHWKMMLFVGQNQMEFSGANYSPDAFKPDTPFVNYIDEAIYFTDDPNVINSFKTKYDDLWTDTTAYGNYANITPPLQRRYPTFPIDPELNFPPQNSFAGRAVNRYNAETQKIDVIMFRITDARHPDAMIAAKNRGVQVRLITEPEQYREVKYLWHSYNVDRMYMAGIPIKHTKHLGLNHQKSVVLYSQGLTIFGSSNWTSASSNSQQEHNYFTTKSWFFDWFVNQFERKWNSSSEFEPFVPLPPDRPVYSLPADQALGQPTTVTLTWQGGPWAHRYDIYLGTDPNNLQLIAADVRTGAPTGTTKETYTLTGLSQGTTYYWRVTGKTMANMTRDGNVWSFTTTGTAPIPPAPANLAATAVSSHQINLSWSDVSDETGYKVERSPNGSSSWVQIGTTAAGAVTYQDQGLTDGTTYHYRVRAFNASGNGPYSNTANATTPQTPPPSTDDVVLYASEASVKVGNWTVVSDSTAAGGARLSNPNASAARIDTPLANPSSYFEMTFNAEAGRPYRLWLRGKADNNYWGNDSVHAQFSRSVTSTGSSVYRIGTTSATLVNLEDCSGCGISGWGWQDNGYGSGVMGPLIYFETSGTQTIRIQVREDGFSIDQIVLSPDTYLTTSPGALKNDSVILPKP